MVLWQGLTEGGTAVPVQVTEAGKVVAEGQEGKEGPPGPPGPPGPQGEYGPGDDVDLGTITASGDIKNGSDLAVASGNRFYQSGGLYIRGDYSSTTGIIKYYNGGYADENVRFELDADGSIKAAGPITTSTGNVAINPAPTTPGCTLHEGGQLYLSRVPDNSTAIYIYKTGETEPAIKLNNNGEITAAGNKAGFTANGELYFTSRGIRYKIFVSQGLVQAEEYTRQMELRERGEALKESVDEKRKPRPTDSVPED